MENLQHLAKLGSEFAFDLYKQCSVANTSNIFVSPLSINVALTMTYAGARGNTAKQMKDVLKFESFGSDDAVHKAFQSIMTSFKEPKESVQLGIANRIYVHDKISLKHEFNSILENYYKSTCVEVDFATRAEEVTKEINNWVESQTKNKIKNLISPGLLHSLTRLVLVNAIYFKSDWINKFNSRDTFPGDFFLDDNGKITTNLMHITSDFNFAEDTTNLKCKILELPYVRNDYSMFIILPNAIQGLKDLESKLNVTVLTKLMDEMFNVEVIVTLPKFKMETSLTLNDNLVNLGMKDLFQQGKADLSGITGHKDLVVSNVLHKAFLDVNEEGSEAAAATAVMAVTYSAVFNPIPPVIFNANHPFITFIRDNETRNILFLGRLMNPK